MNLRPRAVNFDDVWSKLKETAEAIISLKPIERLTWDHNFSDIYFVCVSVPETQSRQLYNAVRDCLEIHTKELRRSLEDQTGDYLLSAYNREWSKYKQGAGYLHNLYCYLNKQLAKEKMDAESQHTFIADDSEGPFPHLGVGDLAFAIWKRELIIPLASKLVKHIIGLIQQIRKLEGTYSAINLADIRGAILSFVEVNELFLNESFLGQQKSPFTLAGGNSVTEFYEEMFEKHFLEATENFYKSLTSEAFAYLDCCPYMEAVIKTLDEERILAQRFLHHSTLPKIENLCYKVLVNEQLEKISLMCKDVVQGELLKDLKNMYILFKPLNNALPILLKEFENYIKKLGMEFNVSPTVDPAQFVGNITDLHTKFTQMVIEIFSGDGEFTISLDRAIQSIVNYREDPKQPPKISEKLNRYIDILMKTRKGRTETEIEAQLSKSILIFRYIDDKDLFQKYYSKMLCTRLIASLSFSMDLEESMINKMKDACGYEFTSKLSRMFTDVNVSQGLTKRFLEEMVKNNKKLEVSISVMVLQAGAWPLTAPQNASEPSSSQNQSEQNLDYAPPIILQTSLRLFEEFYGTSHSGRKLTWLYANSTADVQMNYLDRKYQATMSVHQLSILLQYSNQDVFQLGNFVPLTALSLPTIIRAAKALVETGFLISNEKDLTELSVLTLNTSFTYKRINVKVALPQSSKPQEKEAEATCNTLMQDRKYYMECTIVRIMKARKVMKHNLLVEEVLKQTQSRFFPDVQFIKKNIEALIDKLYIQRTDQNDEYEYIS
uniref:Cullin family profile domain-containing protein n=1 Tax=Meloidogyne incognita TaxID=6306 RepID=A0A914MYS6_MELIC